MVQGGGGVACNRKSRGYTGIGFGLQRGRGEGATRGERIHRGGCGARTWKEVRRALTVKDARSPATHSSAPSPAMVNPSGPPSAALVPTFTPPACAGEDCGATLAAPLGGNTETSPPAPLGGDSGWATGLASWAARVRTLVVVEYSLPVRAPSESKAPL